VKARNVAKNEDLQINEMYKDLDVTIPQLKQKYDTYFEVFF